MENIPHLSEPSQLSSRPPVDVPVVINRGEREQYLVKNHLLTLPREGANTELTAAKQGVKDPQITQAVKEVLPKTVAPAEIHTEEELVIHPLPPPLLQQNSFKTVTRSIIDRPDIQKLLGSEDRQREINDLCTQLRVTTAEEAAEGWNNIIRQYRGGDVDQLAYDGLKAFHAGKLTVEQFATLTYCWSLMKQFPAAEIVSVSVFDPMMEKSFKKSLTGDDRNFFEKNQAEGVNARFFANMKNRERSQASECAFFAVRSGHVAVDQFPESELLREVLVQRIGLKIFQTVKVPPGDFVPMMPSFSMIQACVDAYGQDNTIACCPMIGPSSRNDLLRNLRERGRDVLIPFPHVPLPAWADGFSVNDYSAFLLHDMYHCLIISQVPEKCRQETARIVALISDLQLKHAADPNPFTVPFLENLYGRMVDMEFNLYTSPLDARLKNGEELFLVELYQQIYIRTRQRMKLKLLALPSEGELVPDHLQSWDRLLSFIMKEQHATASSLDVILEKCIEETPVIQSLVDAMILDGFLEKFLFTQESFIGVREICQELIKKDMRPNENTIFFIDYLANKLTQNS